MRDRHTSDPANARTRDRADVPLCIRGFPEAPNTDAAVREAATGSTAAVSRLISLAEAESDPALLRDLSISLSRHCRRAHVVGITGPPGVGKSTLTAALVAVLRTSGVRVAVVAVDPSSPLTGVAFLGDRVRMQQHASDDGVFIRSMASHGRYGGLSPAVPLAIRVLETAGFDTVLVKTVGVGQSEVEIASIADTTVLVLAPGLGDGVQAAKAGTIEVADIFVINKADLPGADNAARSLRHAARARRGAWRTSWQPPIQRAIASERVTSGQESSVHSLADAITEHRCWLDVEVDADAAPDLDRWAIWRQRRTMAEIRMIALDCARRAIHAPEADAELRGLARQVEIGRSEQYAAADRFLAASALWGQAPHSVTGCAT